MKLLIVTQTLDSKDSVLGFFVRWVLEFAKQCEQVTVFCLDKGDDIFPSNVTVIHLARTWRGIKMWPLMLAYETCVHRKKYTHVFAHMNPEYVFSAGWVWKILRKKICLWYAHGKVSLRLKVATAFCNYIFSSTSEGFRYKTSKLHIVGQGIDTSLYNNVHTERGLQKPLSLVSIGRVSASKRLELLFDTVSLLKSKHSIETICTVIGGPVTDKDAEYEKSLQDLVVKNNIQDNIVWRGPLPLIQAIEILKTQDIFVHFGNTGSLDKAVLDTMMCGVIPLTSNTAVKKVLHTINTDQSLLEIHDSQDAATKITRLLSKTEKEIKGLRFLMVEHVQNNFSLEAFIKHILVVSRGR